MQQEKSRTAKWSDLRVNQEQRKG